MKKNKPVLGILLGDAAGVGSEIAAKLLSNGFLEEWCRPVLIGDKRVLDRGLAVTGGTAGIQIVAELDDADWSAGTPMLDQHNVDPDDVPFGRGNRISGAGCLAQIDEAIRLYRKGGIQGIVFAPLNKAMMKEAGCPYESEHHYIAHLIGHTAPFGEINALGRVWTTRTTSHIPIKDVSARLTPDAIGRAIELLQTTLEKAGRRHPKIAVAALNPHAGENGSCGREEIDVIAPSIEEARKKGWDVVGPFPSDTLFVRAFRGEFDGVVTMFHDQGQIALKVMGFDEGITIAGGLPIPIATCGHGTAYDIAGKNIVRTTSFENAVKAAVRMISAAPGEAS